MFFRGTVLFFLLSAMLLSPGFAQTRYGDLSDEELKVIPPPDWYLIFAVGTSGGQSGWDFNSPYFAFQASFHRYFGDSGSNRLGVYFTYMQSRRLNEFFPNRGLIYNNCKKHIIIGLCHHFLLVPKQRICPALGYGFAVMNIRAKGSYEYAFYEQSEGDGACSPSEDDNQPYVEEREVRINDWRMGVLLSVALRINLTSKFDLEFGLFQTLGIKGINKDVVVKQEMSGGKIRTQITEYKVPLNETILTAGLAFRL